MVLTIASSQVMTEVMTDGRGMALTMASSQVITKVMNDRDYRLVLMLLWSTAVPAGYRGSWSPSRVAT